MLPESECPYFAAKGMHLYVPHKYGGDVCHGCGLAGKDSYYDCPFTLVLHGKRCVLSRRHKGEHELVRVDETDED